MEEFIHFSSVKVDDMHINIKNTFTDSNVVGQWIIVQMKAWVRKILKEGFQINFH